MSRAGFMLFLASLPVIQAQEVSYTSTQVCAPKGSTVDLKCSYTDPPGGNPLERPSWFRPGSNGGLVDLRTDPEYSGRVQYPNDGKDCTLRITDLRESDAAVYSFRSKTQSPGGSPADPPGVTLSVTDLQLTGTLFCRSPGCPNPGPFYVWYVNGEEISENSASMMLSLDWKNSYSCALKGFEDLPTPPLCINAHRLCFNKVTYDARNICAVKGSSVNISARYRASYNGLDTDLISTSWFRSDRITENLSEDTQYEGRVEVTSDSNTSDSYTENSNLRITDLRLNDSAEYRFTFASNKGLFEWGRSLVGTRLTVTELHVKISSYSSSSSSNWVNLECISSCRLPDGSSFVWYKNGAFYEETTSSSLQGSFGPADNISCAVRGLEDFPSPPLYGPKSPSVSLSPSGGLLEGTSVTLSCSSDANPAAHYTWYKEDLLLSEGPALVFRSIQLSDSGLYHCIAKNQLGTRTSEPVSVSVEYGPKSPFVSLSPSGGLLEGTSVTLSCSSDANPAAHYTWYKEDLLLSEGPALVFRSIRLSDSGLYHCIAKNQLGTRTSEPVSVSVEYGPKSPFVSLSPSGGLLEGTSVTLSCSSDANPAAHYTWYKEGLLLSEGPALVFRSIQLSDSGLYHCIVKDQLGTRTSEPVSVSVEYNPIKTMNIIRLCLVPLIPIPLLLFKLWFRKKYPPSSISEAGGQLESVEIHSCPPPSPQAEEDKDYELVE